MIKIKQSVIDSINRALTPQDLYPFLQKAIGLELATIPPYLSGLFTLQQTSTGQVNADVAGIMTSVVNEEMLHLCIAANTLTALGGTPVLNTDLAVSGYPGTLPDDADDGLVIHLRPFSMDAVLNTYMRIEEPDVIVQPSGPKKIPLEPAPPTPGEFQSIGDFYQAIIGKVKTFKDSAINPDPTSTNQKNQVVGAFFMPAPPNLPVAITNIQSAVDALSLIVDQGEGTSTGDGSSRFQSDSCAFLPVRPDCHGPDDRR